MSRQGRRKHHTHPSCTDFSFAEASNDLASVIAEPTLDDILSYRRPNYEPDTEQLRSRGWSIISTHGRYCTAWKGNQEILLVWRDGNWERVSWPGIPMFRYDAIAS